jgi:aminopeptidase N
MYAKGANLLHTIRQVIDNDAAFKKILRGLNKEFYHKTVDSKDVENYISQQSGKDLSKIFDQYLRTTKIPVLEYKFTGDNLYYRWSNCVKGFNMPVKLDGAKEDWLKATEDWKTVAVTVDILKDGLKIDRNFYITVKKVE